MIKHKKKLCTILIGSILIFSVSVTINYQFENSTKHILIKNLYNNVESTGVFDAELLKEHNQKNMQKLEKGKELSAEDYFFIAYEYCVIKKERAEGIKYAAIAKEKQHHFSNKFIKFYNNYLIDYYHIYIQKDENIFEKLDDEFSSITIYDWNKYTNLLNSKLALFSKCDNGTDYIINTVEDILKKERILKPQVIAMLKDMLVATYKQKGYHAKVLELSLETKVLLQNYDIKYGDSYMARALLNEAHVYKMLSDNTRAEKVLNEALEIPIENEILNRDVKVSILDKLISICLTEGYMDKIPELINQYNYYMTDDNDYNSNELYYLSLARYHMDKYEKDRSSKVDLYKADEALKLAQNCFSGHVGINNLSIDTYKCAYSIYLEYLKGNVQYALDKYNDLLIDVTDRSLEIFILENVYKICVQEEMYKEANQYCMQISNIKSKESLLINSDYSALFIKKYENELEIRTILKEKRVNFIKWFGIISVLSTITIIVIIKNNSLRKNNITDGLTRINNRLYFDEVYNKKLKKNQSFSICMLDIDNFKNINDTYGHLIGDEVLKKVAATVKDVVENKGEIFRYGGEEFAIILNLKDKKLIANIAEKIRKEVENLTWDNNFKITISMGVADSSIEKDKIIKVADNRLYISKNTGKNKITFDN